MSGTKGILGYRDLSDAEKDLINEVKAHAEKTRELTERIRSTLLEGSPGQMSLPAEAGRWLSIGVTDLQKGFMSVIRSIARPSTF